MLQQAVVASRPIDVTLAVAMVPLLTCGFYFGFAWPVEGLPKAPQVLRWLLPPTPARRTGPNG